MTSEFQQMKNKILMNKHLSQEDRQKSDLKKLKDVIGYGFMNEQDKTHVDYLLNSLIAACKQENELKVNELARELTVRIHPIGAQMLLNENKSELTNFTKLIENTGYKIAGIQDKINESIKNWEKVDMNLKTYLNDKVKKLLGIDKLVKTGQDVREIEKVFDACVESLNTANYQENVNYFLKLLGADKLDENIQKDLREKLDEIFRVIAKAETHDKNFTKKLETARQLFEHYYPKKEVDESYKKQSKVLRKQYYSEEENSKAKKVSKDEYKWEKF